MSRSRSSRCVAFLLAAMPAMLAPSRADAGERDSPTSTQYQTASNGNAAVSAKLLRVARLVRDPSILKRTIASQRKHLASLRRRRQKAQAELDKVRRSSLSRLERLKTISDAVRRQMAVVSLEAETRAAEASIVVEIRQLDGRIAKFGEEVNRLTRAVRTVGGAMLDGANDGEREKSYPQLLQAQAAEAQRYFEDLLKDTSRSASAAQ